MKKSLGEQHIKTASVYSDLGNLYWKLNKMEAANNYLEKALIIYDKEDEKE